MKATPGPKDGRVALTLENLTSSKSRYWYNPRNGFMCKSCRRPILLRLI